jgi:hypothetical protein
MGRRHPRRFAAPASVAAAVGMAVMCVLAGCGSASARGGSVRGPQLDIVLRTQVGMGAGMNAPLHFPDARFTFFAFEDPTFCLTGMQLFDSSGSVIGGELFERPTFVANVPVPLVQQDLPAGDYRLRVSTATSHCAWMVEEILNSMSSHDAPPAAEPAPVAQPTSATVSTQSTPFAISESGLYNVSWSVTSPAGAMCPYKIALRDSSGGMENIDQQPEPQPPNQPPGPTPGGAGSGEVPLFLSAGIRTVSAQTVCPWMVSIRPLVGPNGGGVRGFAPMST